MKESRQNQHTEACAEAPSGIDVVDAFITCLSLCSPMERELLVEYLRSKVCLFCGAIDPDCECWLTPDAGALPS